jgi:predicted O-methyltransferase YrrM
VSLAVLAYGVPDTQAIVELGVFCGRTALQMAWGAQQGRGAHVWGIDSWELPGGQYGPPFNEQATRVLAHKNIHDQGYADQITLIHAFSQDVAVDWDGPPIGLLFVDADHSAEGARRDITAWAPHLAPGAMLAVDDYHHPDWPGVAEAVDALVAEGFLKPVDVLYERLAVTQLTRAGVSQS